MSIRHHNRNATYTRSHYTHTRTGIMLLSFHISEFLPTQQIVEFRVVPNRLTTSMARQYFSTAKNHKLTYAITVFASVHVFPHFFFFRFSFCFPSILRKTVIYSLSIPNQSIRPHPYDSEPELFYFVGIFSKFFSFSICRLSIYLFFPTISSERRHRSQHASKHENKNR